MKRKYTFFKFLALMGKSLPIYLFAMVVHMVGDNFLNLSLSYYIHHLIDMAQIGDMSGFWNLTFICVMISLISLLVFFVLGALYDIYAKRGNSYVQKMMITKLFKLPMSYFDRHHSGEIVSKIMNDADTASQIFTSRLRRVTTPLMSVIVYIIPMYIISPVLATCIVVINALSLFVNSKYVPLMKSQGKEMSRCKSELTQVFLDIIACRDLFKVFTGTGLLVDKFKKKNIENEQISRGYWNNTAGLSSINTFFDMVCSLGFLLVSIVLVKNRMCTLGGVAAIYALYGTFSFQFLQLGKYFPELIHCIARADIVFDFMEEQEEEDNEKAHVRPQNEETENLSGTVAFKNVSFAYGEHTVLSNYSVKFNGNCSTALIGPTGCGKSTLIKLILKLYPLQAGEIMLDGKNIDSIGLEALRQKISYIPQNPFLFQESIRENIRYGNLSATDEDIVNAAKLANAHNFISKLPNGYDTLVLDGGKNFSGGEQQRIAIARAFVKKAPYLIMDEATSALDNKNESEVLSAMKNIMKNRTSIVVAHRKMTIDACDRVCECTGRK